MRNRLLEVLVLGVQLRDRKTVTPASLWQHPNLELISRL